MNRFIKALRALSPDCKEAIRLQSDALERPLNFFQRLGLRLHLPLCRWCRRYGRQIRFLRAAAHKHPEQLCAPDSRELSPEARERLKKSLQQG